VPKPTQSLATEFIRRTNILEASRAKMENLFTAGHIAQTDIEQVYAGLFLNTFSEFEALIEDLFLGLLMSKLYSKTYTIIKRARITPVTLTQEIVFNGRYYLDWLPYDNFTLPRAKRYFVNGEPFKQLDEIQKKSLTDYHMIRNAIAHKSDSAQKKFQNLISGLTLYPHEKSPSGYLRSRPRGTGQTQYEVAVIELEVIARKLCA
jgi:hypothetical protein